MRLFGLNKNSISDIRFYSLIGILEKVSPFLIVAVGTIYLSNETIGEYSYFLIWISLFASLFTLESPRFLEYIQLSNRVASDHLDVFITTSFVYIIFSLISIFILPFYFSWKEISLLIIGTYFHVIKNFYFYLLRLLNDKHRYTQELIKLLLFRLTLFIALVVVYRCDNSTTLVLIYILPLGLVSLSYLVRNIKNINLKTISFVEIKRSILFTFNFLPFTLSGISQNQMDKFFIYNVLSPSDLGIYAVLNSLAQPIKLASNSLSIAVTPKILLGESISDKNDNVVLGILLSIVSVAVLCLALLMLFFFYEISIRDYWLILVLICIGLLFRGLKQVVLPSIVRSGILKSFWIEFFINVFFGLSLAWFSMIYLNLGMHGAALTFVLSQFLSYLIYFLYLKWR